jgi:cytochrome c
MRAIFSTIFMCSALLSGAAAAEGDAARGASLFRHCAACHSVEPGRHMTGPSLADLWGKKAGATKSFLRYSDALLESDVIWNEKTLDAWLKNPREFIPGNEMAFPGIADAQARADLIAYLKSVSEGEPAGGETARGGRMMGGGRMPKLSKAPLSEQVSALRYCKDTYFVTTAAGETFKMWEFNLRFKTDSSEYGPRPGKPVLVGTGMRGDRAQLVFAAPEEIGALIKHECPQ